MPALSNAGLCWMGHSNPRHVRNYSVPGNSDIRENDEARARQFATKLGVTEVGIERAYCVTTSIASAIPSKIIFVDDLIASKAQVIDLPAEVLITDTAGNEIANMKVRDDKATLDLANKVYSFLTELLQKFRIIIVNASISCRTGGLKGCSPEIFFSNSEKYNHFLETLVDGRQFDPEGRIHFNPLNPYRYAQATANDPLLPKAPADSSTMLKDKIHPFEQHYIQRVRGFLFNKLYCVRGVEKTGRKSKRKLSRAEKSARTRARLAMD